MSVQLGSPQRKTHLLTWWFFFSSFWSLEVLQINKATGSKGQPAQTELQSIFWRQGVKYLCFCIKSVTELSVFLFFQLGHSIHPASFQDVALIVEVILWMMALLPAVISSSTAFRVSLSLSLIYNMSLLWPVLVFLLSHRSSFYECDYLLYFGRHRQLRCILRHWVFSLSPSLPFFLSFSNGLDSGRATSSWVILFLIRSKCLLWHSLHLFAFLSLSFCVFLFCFFLFFSPSHHKLFMFNPFTIFGSWRLLHLQAEVVVVMMMMMRLVFKHPKQVLLRVMRWRMTWMTLIIKVTTRFFSL